MRAMIKAAAAVSVLLMATPALAMTAASTPTAAGLKGARFLSAGAALVGSPSEMQAAMVGGARLVDGSPDLAWDAAGSEGYLLSAEPTAPGKAGVVEREFEDEPVTYRAPGTTIVYRKAPAAQVVVTPVGQ